MYSKIPEKSLTLEQFHFPEIANRDYVKIEKAIKPIDSARDNVPILHLELMKALA